jgi:hypothetical protein
VGATPAKKNKIHPPQENGDCGRNLHTLCVPFFGDVRIKEYAFEKHLTHTHTHTHLKNARAYQLCLSSGLSLRGEM